MSHSILKLGITEMNKTNISLTLLMNTEHSFQHIVLTNLVYRIFYYQQQSVTSYEKLIIMY